MTATTPDIVERRGPDAVARQQRLAAAVKRLRTSTGGANTAKTLMFIGGVLVPLGLVLIVLGWSGAAGTTDVFEQIPYAISGGMLGLAVVFAGGFCYFASWMTHMVYASRTDAEEMRSMRETLERIETLLAAATDGSKSAKGGAK